MYSKVDERDMSQEMIWYNEAIAGKCLAALKRNGIDGFYVSNRDEALLRLIEMIPPGKSVGFGDSVTMLQVGIVQELEKRGTNELIHPWRKNGKDYRYPIQEAIKICKKAMLTDIYLTGTNAITLDGKLFNIDALGNRVAPMIFGPDKVIVVTGVNKIVRDIEEATRRVKGFGAGVNSRRHTVKHPGAAVLKEYPPCSITGVCVDCKPPLRVCISTVIIECESRGLPKRLEIVLVGETMGI